MLRIYPLTIQNCRECRPLIERIKLSDANLADQLKRGITAVPLHIAEAAGLRGGSRTLRHRTALGEQGEAIAAIDVARAMNYIEHVNPELLDRMRRVQAVLTKLTK